MIMGSVVAYMLRKSGVFSASFATWSSCGTASVVTSFQPAALVCFAFCFFHRVDYGYTRAARQGHVMGHGLGIYYLTMREFAKDFYSSGAWKNCRANYLKYRQGLCEPCLAKGLYTPAEIVHHKVELSPDNISDPSITLCFDNLQCVCRLCHAAAHGSDRRWDIDESGHVTARR